MGVFYYGIEILWRGYSHLAMIIVAGLCGVLIGYINEYFTWDMLVWKQCGIATIIVLIVEFISGCILNLWLGLNIWSYAGVPFNLLGQICLQFALAWLPLTLVAILLDDLIRWKLFNEEKPRYRWK
ncbi:MAG: hypothetical protein FH753_01055 [Firmicutes bacterium]|nr:hypothetical protein [Bacillota bacterium]